MKILLIGYGYVGKAVAHALSYHHDIVVIDPEYSSTTIADNADAECAIVCVPTPWIAKGGCDSSILSNVISQIPVQMPILVKSTVTPAIVEALEGIFPDHWIMYSPEFLRARSANQDFYNQKYIVLGGEDEDCFWQDILQESLPNCSLVFNCTAKEAALIKYASNSFLALKTTFFNQLFDICEADNIDFDTVRHILTQDTRIGTDHTMVPGPDGERGWGGHCFPKDTSAFMQYAESLNTPISTLETAVLYNKTVRKDLDF